MKELQLGGTHYFLNADKNTALRKSLEIEAIPHYILLDRSGKIVSEENSKIKELAQPAGSSYFQDHRLRPGEGSFASINQVPDR